ncbi:hypothetical protein PR048_019920 [Dryococelus australis]|uniref:Uncharacterized protein n=1 Tax=Dryococelus australis TaxID=614101 RepID=A0ABQ9H4X8_9NEOP|nr:hypothetical protein PR048_019920 [Dryococelus australis]
MERNILIEGFKASEKTHVYWGWRFLSAEGNNRAFSVRLTSCKDRMYKPPVEIFCINTCSGYPKKTARTRKS